MSNIAGKLQETKLKLAMVAAVSAVCFMTVGVAHAGDPIPSPADFDAQLRNSVAASQEPAPEADAAGAVQTTPADPRCDKDQVWVADDGLGHPGCFPDKTKDHGGTAGFNLGGASSPRPKKVMVVNQAPPVFRTAGAKINLSITFYSNSAKLTPEAQQRAERFAATLAMPTWKGKHIEIDGYTDAVGSADHNLMLSQQRAEAVRSYILSQGGDPSTLRAQGFGSKELADPEHPGASVNRRVMARVLD